MELYPYVDEPDDAAREAKAFLTRTAAEVGVKFD